MLRAVTEALQGIECTRLLASSAMESAQDPPLDHFGFHAVDDGVEHGREQEVETGQEDVELGGKHASQHGASRTSRSWE